MFRLSSSTPASFQEEPPTHHTWSLSTPVLAAPQRKERGAYYTDPVVAAFLVQWAVRSAAETVLEPCFGGGVFLECAIDRLEQLGGSSRSLVGVEQDPTAFAVALRALGGKGEPSPDLVNADFFRLDHRRLGRHAAIVGNPPFIRYQRFNGDRRDHALARASERGVNFTRLASAWAPFIVHATSFLKPGGRLAMVAPAELCHAAYARSLLKFLTEEFARVRILTFGRRLFPRLNEDTVLILAESFGSTGGDLRLVALPDASALREWPTLELSSSAPIAVNGHPRTQERFTKHLLPARIRELYDELTRRADVVRLGAIATVGIGYVTGNNDFFHMTAAEARRCQVPAGLLRRAVCRSSWLAGLTFTAEDWIGLDRSGLRTRLLALSGHAITHDGVRAYLDAGRRKGVHRAYKCRVRDPWWAVPGVEQPEMVLTYMANERSHLVVNKAGAVVPNTLLCVRRKRHAPTPEALAVGWCTSLSALSAEIEGHSLGGGMLKLEPGESIHALLPVPDPLNHQGVDVFASELDRLLRTGARPDAIDLADRHLLGEGLGLSERERQFLRDGARVLAERRRRR